jgi:hypothetical protein
MIVIAIALLQATAPMQTSATAEPAAAPAVEAEEQAPPAATKPKMKRVCRMKMDPRVGTLSSRQRVCEYVRADGDSSPK